MAIQRWLLAATLALALGAAGSAKAQDSMDTRGDLNVLLKGGIGDYTGGLSNHTTAGPTWGVLVNVQPMTMLGYEIAYDGSRNLVDDDRLAETPALTRHGVTGLVKLSPPFLERVKPFVGAGFGAATVRVDEESQDLYQGDLVQEVPVAAGLEFNTPGFTAGLRTTWRWLVDESFASPAADGNPQGGFFDAGVTLGGRF